MLKIRYAKKYLWAQMSKYSWAKALAPGHMGMGPWPGPRAWPWPPPPPPPPGTTDFPGGGQGPWAQGHGPRPMCPGAKALAHEYFDIWAHKYF